MSILLKPVTSQNRSLAEALAIRPEQQGFIESVKQCMEEADELEAWRPMCIYDGSTLAGFAMYGFFLENGQGRLWFDRLLIDWRFQHKGLGKAAVFAILQKMRQDYPPQDIYLSVYSPNKTAISLYEAAGFRFNGELDTGGEQVMVLSADSPVCRL